MHSSKKPNKTLNHLSKAQSIWLSLFSLLAFSSIALGAFGAHALSSALNEKAISWWQTGCQYMMYHALGGMFITLLLDSLPTVRFSLWAFLLGSLAFSGSLFTMSLSGITLLGMVTPIGGLFFLFGWGWLIFVFSRSVSRT
ncbi:DUF423 domain-containing protein [Marinomonas sp. 2405UD68-3]|uniref:DUF423 domain-containing protein n=1 Tax=Marinomonas sp. 2405UD68-3 TaxID=3391835 RepID=UPI0039C8FA0A